MSTTLSWCLFAALIVAFFTFLVLMAVDDGEFDEGEDVRGDLDSLADDRPPTTRTH